MSYRLSLYCHSSLSPLKLWPELRSRSGQRLQEQSRRRCQAWPGIIISVAEARLIKNPGNYPKVGFNLFALNVPNYRPYLHL